MKTEPEDLLDWNDERRAQEAARRSGIRTRSSEGFGGPRKFMSRPKHDCEREPGELASIDFQTSVAAWRDAIIDNITHEVIAVISPEGYEPEDWAQVREAVARGIVLPPNT